MAYTATVTPKSVISLPIGVHGYRMDVGSVDITNYNQTLAEITDITKKFRSTPIVVCNGLSDNNFVVMWSPSDKAFKAYAPGASSLVIEEAVTVASNVGTLTRKPAYIVAVDVTAGTTTGPFNVIPTGETPLTLQVAVTFTSGLMTFLSTDAVTAVRVTYIPQMAHGPFSAANLVVDESIVASASKTTLAARAFAVQYAWDDTDGVLEGLEPVGEAPSATHKAVVDITNGSSTTDIDFHADDATNTIKVTYLKYSGLDASVLAIGDADITLSGSDPEQYDFDNEGFYEGLVVPGLGTQLVGETGAAANVQLIWSGPSATTGAGVPTWHPDKNTVRTKEGTAVATLAIPFFVLNPSFMSLGSAMKEAANGTDIGAVDFIAIGR